MTMINAFDPTVSPLLDNRIAALIARRMRLLGPAYRLFYENPVHIVRAQGTWLYDPEGQAYLDVYNNVACVGHCHPHVVAAVATQTALLQTHTRYLDENILNYADRLLSTFPRELGHVMFTCSGSEANDLALRIAREVTGNKGIIVTKLAYHGVTAAVAEISPSLGEHSALGKEVCTIPAPDGYRGDPDVGAALRRAVERSIALMGERGIKPAALIVDTIFASDGIFSNPRGFLGEAVAAIRAAGALFIADEVQAGFGRLGGMWGFSRHDVTPDIVSLGKPMGNGYPVAAVVIRPELVREFGARARYFSTFGGNPVAAAAASAVLDVIEQEGLVNRAAAVGSHLRSGLDELAKRHENIGDIRGDGLFVGLELVTDRQSRRAATKLATTLVNRLRERRILISACGPNANVLKIRPPLAFDFVHADHFLNALDETLHALNMLKDNS